MWNYRVIKNFVNGEDVFAIHECYYNQDGSIFAVSAEAIFPMGETIDDLRLDLSYMISALNRPMLTMNEIKFSRPDWERGSDEDIGEDS